MVEKFHRRVFFVFSCFFSGMKQNSSSQIESISSEKRKKSSLYRIIWVNTVWIHRTHTHLDSLEKETFASWNHTHTHTHLINAGECCKNVTKWTENHTHIYTKETTRNFITGHLTLIQTHRVVIIESNQYQFFFWLEKKSEKKRIKKTENFT